MRKQKGFTLIELLVVIAIIGLLSTLAVVALNNARQKARDARRVSDIKQIQTALELYYNDEGGYPASLTTSLIGPKSGITYMNAVPANQTPVTDGNCETGSAYTYAQTADAYTLKYCLGAQTGGIPAGVQTASPAGIQ